MFLRGASGDGILFMYTYPFLVDGYGAPPFDVVWSQYPPKIYQSDVQTKLKVKMLSFKLISSQLSIQMGLLIPLNLADCQLQKCCFKPILGYLAEHQPWNSAATVGGIVISWPLINYLAVSNKSFISKW